MLVSLEKQKAVLLKKALAESNLVGQVLSQTVLKNQRKHGGWDGYIHPSSLNWNSSPEAQLKKLKKTWEPNEESLKRMQIGNLVHEYIQEVLSKELLTNLETEQHIEDNKILFRGTPDQMGHSNILGDVLFEFKSVSSYQRNKSYADKIMKKINVPTDLMEAVHSSLCIQKVDYTEPEADHLTQLFTYIWVKAFRKERVPDYGCVCYLRKENLGTMEFYYKTSEHKDLILKARDNYQQVYNLVLKDEDGIRIRRENKEKYG